MTIFIYALIFFSKVLENALSTLRLIVVANGQKFFGATLLFVISLIWIAITGIVIIDIWKDPLKIFFFALGSFFGSYVGSIIEEKMALGSNMLIVIIDKISGSNIINNLRTNNYAVTVIDGEGKDNDKNILMIMTTRKKRKNIVKIIKEIDSSSMIIAESAMTITGGYPKEKSN